ncbi:MAG TPA: insulinase family protein [Gemmatimonadaceae bacterium]|nr:insulinase family protein [Gemmatimonadaceae bacterium]
MPILLMLQLLAATGAAPAATRLELPNGLRVWIQEDHRRPVALVQVTYKVGSLDEMPGQTGIAHYVEHMVYRATQHVRNEDVYGYIDRIGGRYTGGTWPEFTQYGELIPSWAVESALRVTAERMCCALFDSTEFERERHNVITEANGFSETDPLATMRDAVMYAAFDVHPYRLNSDSWARDNLVVTRDEAFRWYKDHYGPNNAVLVIVGDVATDSVRAMVQRHFAQIRPAPLSGRITVVEPPQHAEKRVVVRAPGVRPEMDIMYHAPDARHVDFGALTLVTRLLRHRLPPALRSAGVNAVASVSDSASQYPYVLQIVIDADSARDLDRALAALDGEVNRLAAGEVSDTELASARAPEAPVQDAGRDAGGGAVPPRRSYLTQMAEELTDREALPWELTSADVARARATAQRVTVAEIASFARRWLRPSNRTLGFVRPGPDDFVATWSDGRPLAGDRMEIPPLTTTPAQRMLPEAVPARALQPLAPLSIRVQRRAVGRSGVVLSVITSSPSRSLVRLQCDCSDTAYLQRAAQLLRGDTSLARADVMVRVIPGRPDTAASAEALARRRAVRAAIPESGGTSNELIAAVVTDSAHAWVVGRVDRALASIGPIRITVADVSRARADSGSEQRVSMPGEKQVAVVAALPGVARSHPDRRALELLAYIVGVPSYGGRLGWALTKSGLTYAAAVTNEFRARAGAIVISTECDTRNTDATIQAIREVVAGVGARGVDAWELREAQAFMLGRTLLYGARDDSDADALAAALVQSEFGDLQLEPSALSRAYLDVTLDDLNRVARRYFRPDALHIVAVGAIPSMHESIFAPGTFRALFDP